MLERGAEVTSSNTNGRTALHLCVLKHAHTEFARLLLGHGASANAMDEQGNSALHMAIRSRDVDMTRVLLKYGADANQRDRNGSTMLKYCIHPLYRYLEDLEILQLLLESGANSKLVNGEGKVPFVVACEESLITAIYLLLPKGLEMGRSGSFVIEAESETAAISFVSVRSAIHRQSCNAAATVDTAFTR